MVRILFVPGFMDLDAFPLFDYTSNRDFVYVRTGAMSCYNEKIKKSLLDLLTEGQASSHIVLCGHSYGCYIIYRFLVDLNPKLYSRILRVVLINSALQGGNMDSRLSPMLYRYVLQPFLYMSSRLARCATGTKNFQGDTFSDFGMEHTLWYHGNHGQEQDGKYFCDLVEKHHIQVTNIVTSILFPRDTLSWISYALSVLVTGGKTLFYENDGWLLVRTQSLPKSSYIHECRLVASHTSSVGSRVFLLGGKTRETTEVRNLVIRGN